MGWVDDPCPSWYFGCDRVDRRCRHGVSDGFPDGVQSGQGTVYLQQAAHSKGTKIDGREPEVVDDRAEQFFGALVIAGVVQELVVKPLTPVQLRKFGEAAATIVQAIDTADRARKLSDPQSQGQTNDCQT
jgi:hypothetical protein